MSLTYELHFFSQKTAKAPSTTYKNPEAISPPFPGGLTPDIAPLETIDFAKLAQRDASELDKLLHESKTRGFFYLDLQKTEQTLNLLSEEREVLRVMDKYFAQPVEEKMKEDRQSVLHGYKPVGTFSGVDKNTRDCYETLKVAREEMVTKSPKLPATVQANVDLFDSFMTNSHYVTHTLLACLSDALRLPASQRLEMAHRDGQPTNTTLVMLRYPKDADPSLSGHNKHTDIGSITLLFSDQWGLQVVTPETKSWTFVQPRRGHAIINVGDSLRFLSGKQLMSCLHRVVPVREASTNRYSIAYFLRPESNAKFEDADGKKVSAAEWHDAKYVMFAEPHEKQEQSAMLTGGMERVLVPGVA